MNARDMIESGELVWFRNAQVGYVHPVEPFDYGEKYFDEYVRRSKLPMSKDLMVIRENMVRDHYAGELLDFGCGSCTFVEHMVSVVPGDVKGYAINPWAVQCLTNSRLYRDPWFGRKPDSVSFWDVLEHLPDPEAAINRVGTWAFVSIPIFSGPDDVMMSKHYKPNEHIWYFTEYGLTELFLRCGFSCIDSHTKENRAGREGIVSFVFKRVLQ